MDDMDLAEVQSGSDDYRFFIDNKLKLVIAKKTSDSAENSNKMAHIDNTRKMRRSEDRLKPYSIPIVYGDKTTDRITVTYACMNIIGMHAALPPNS
jgi:hypothetical protein